MIEISNNAESRATLNVFGGKLVVQDGLTRNNVTAATIPTINLTGGELELTPARSELSLGKPDMELNGTDFDPKPGAVLSDQHWSNPTRPANFSLNSGSIWDLDIASNTLVGGADWVDVQQWFGCSQRRPVQHPPYRRLHACRLATRLRILRNLAQWGDSRLALPSATRCGNRSWRLAARRFT